MKPTGWIRRIDEFGKIVIPLRLRIQMGIEANAPFELFVDGDKIVLVPYKFTKEAEI